MTKGALGRRILRPAKDMRKALAVALFLIVSNSAISAAQSSPEKSFRIPVKVRGVHVHFRKYPPRSLDDSNIIRYTEWRETFIADAVEIGPAENPEKSGPWYHLRNVASEETGWVAGKYVVAINDEDAAYLAPPDSAAETNQASPQLGRTDNITSIIASIFSVIASFFSLKVLLASKRASSGTAQAAPKASAPAPNVLAFHAPPNREPSSVSFGSSGGAAWVIHRPKARN